MAFHRLETQNAGQLGLGILREAPDGARTLCLAPQGFNPECEGRLGDVISGHAHADGVIGEAVAPLVARFASMVFTESTQMIEPFLEQLRWLAVEHGIDHVVLPLWPEAPLADEIQFAAIAMGLPTDFILTQDESTWPHQNLMRQSDWMRTA
ncbi:MAG: hypothetical protein AB7G06_06165 [Bdellovibrionales bacterium]